MTTDCSAPIAPLTTDRWALGPNGVADAAAYYLACVRAARPTARLFDLVEGVQDMAYADGMTIESARTVAAAAEALG